MLERRVTGLKSKVKPEQFELHDGTLRVRLNIKEDADGWTYDEDIGQKSDYDDIMNFKTDIPDGEWHEGFLELYRLARYSKYDNIEQSIRRKIELEIDVEENKKKLRAILDYKQAVHDTQNQPGYPTAKPIWPPEPVL